MMNRKPELLAPVGHIESFHAAVESGADAVYLGLKKLSARASAVNFTLDELANIVPYAHKRGVAVYVAMNSVVAAGEVPSMSNLLQSVSDIGADAVIAQDPGIFFIARKLFPKLKIHASTLMTAHNHSGVKSLQAMGASRVVLARELTLEEIEQISAATDADLEIFVHGALCYSYSGLCMTSSFRGGHSGLQGRCVQPCRLRFKQGRKDGFFLSCNDFCALPHLPQLKKMRVASFKIEGRMKSADYISQVVRAYRLVLDAKEGNEADALAKGMELLAQSPSRRLTSGYLKGDFNAEVLSPHRSGSSGLWVGTVKALQDRYAVVVLRGELRPGDRLRPESGEGKEHEVFTVSKILSLDGTASMPGVASGMVMLPLAGSLLAPGDRLFRIGGRSANVENLWRKVYKETVDGVKFRKTCAERERLWSEWPSVAVNPRRAEETLILKIGSMGELSAAFQTPAQVVMFTATRSNLERLAKQRLIPAQKQRLVWSLPTIIHEREIDYYRAAVEWYIGKGFNSWEINNWGHLDFFEKGGESLSLTAGARLNTRNVAAMAAAAEAGCGFSVLSLETTGEELEEIGRGPFATVPVVTVYAWPPLFTSRLTPGLLEEKPFFSPKGDEYAFLNKAGTAHIYGDRPMNWFERLPAFRALGYRCFLVDLSEGPHSQARDMERILSGYKRHRSDEPFSTFNLARTPDGRIPQTEGAAPTAAASQAKRRQRPALRKKRK